MRKSGKISAAYNCDKIPGSGKIARHYFTTIMCELQYFPLFSYLSGSVSEVLKEHPAKQFVIGKAMPLQIVTQKNRLRYLYHRCLFFCVAGNYFIIFL